MMAEGPREGVAAGTTSMNRDEDLRPVERAHGGDESAAECWPGAPRPVLDLSTGINPHAYPLGPVDRKAWGRLPQRRARERAERSAAVFFGVERHDSLLLAPGSQILINQLPFLFEPTDVVVAGPTYAEHESCWTRAGHRVLEIADSAEAPAASILIVTNPNNPDGRIHQRRVLVERARASATSGGCLILDEAYGELAPQESLAPFVGHLPVIVLRSFGKFFGLGGLRLGALLASPQVCRRMKDRLGPWSVSGPALDIASRAYSDREWIAATRSRLAREAVLLDQILVGAGLEVIGGTDLFRLVRHRLARSVFEGLGRRGILVRRFEARPHWFRVGLPPEESARRRFETALKEVMSDVRERLQS